MADQTVTLVLDAAQYYREIGKITGQTDKFKHSADRTGESLDGLRVKTEGRVAANIGAIARSFSSGGSAADIFAEAVTRIGESFRGSLLFAGAAAAGVGLYEAIVKTGEAMIKLDSEVKNLTRSRGTSDFLGTDDINKNLNDIGEKIEEIYAGQVARSHNQLFSLGDFLGGGNPLEGLKASLNEADQKKVNELQVKAGEDINDLAEKTDKLNKVEDLRRQGLKTQADIEDNEIKRLERLAAIARTAVLAGADGTAAIRAANRGFDITPYNALTGAALGGNIPSSGIQAFKNAFAQQLVRPFNTGPLLENQAGVAEDLSRFQAKQGDLIESARLHRIAVEKHGQAEAIAQGRELLGNETIQNLKFEGLLHLDKLEFKGLETLSNISISIQ